MFILNIICYFINSSSNFIVLLSKLHCSVSVCSTSLSVICKACWVVMISFHFCFSWKSIFHLCLRTRASLSKIVWVDWFSFFQTFGYITLFSPALQGFHENLSILQDFLKCQLVIFSSKFQDILIMFYFSKSDYKMALCGYFLIMPTWDSVSFLSYMWIPICFSKKGKFMAFFH